MSRDTGRVLVLIMAGGTGGHVFPGLAVAEALHAAGHEVAWLGTRRGLEARVVPAAGLTLEPISISGLRGKGRLTLLLAPVRLVHAVWQSLRVLRRLHPAVVLGMGGFVSGPGGLAAWLMRIPLCIHEQNAVAGLTNRLLSRLADRALEAFDGSLPPVAGAEAVGNPVRRQLHELPAPAERLAGRSGPLRLLVIGGSQGAHRLNQLVPAALSRIAGRQPVTVWHQSGPAELDLVRRSYATLELEARVVDFIDDMPAVYAWTDLVICRAGALTVSELTAVGLASVLVPYPHAVDDHQTVNARWLCDSDAAVLMPENGLTPAALADTLMDLGADRPRLQLMAANARRLARPDAADRVAAACLEVAA